MKVLRIALDANEANVPHRVGSNIYAYKLLLQLERQTREDSEFSFVVYLSSVPEKDFPVAREGWRYRVLTPGKLWTQWRFPIELFWRRSDFDLVVSLGHYAPRFCPIPSVICVLDLAFLKFPQFFRARDLYQLTSWTAYSVRQAHHVVTISQNSKADIIQVYDKKPQDISIVYPGAEFPIEREDSTDEAKTLVRFGVEKGKYFVCVGTIQPRKNMINLIHAFEKLTGSALEYKLVFVGKLGWLTNEFSQALAMSPRKKDIIVTGFVSEQEKYALLRGAMGSILVGFYEGFGIPVIESMGVGTLPLVANTGSLPEVVGENGILVDPYSVDSIASGLMTLAHHTTSPSEKKRMKERAAEFGWDKSGAAFLSVLRSVTT